MTLRHGLCALALGMLAVPASASVVPLTTDFYSFGGGFSDNDRLIVNNPGAGDPFESVGFLGFDLSAFSGTQVASATLTMQMYCNPGLTCSGDAPGQSLDIAVNSLGIDPASVTDGSGVGALLASIGPEAASVTTSVPGIYVWDLTTLVNSWLADPSLITGIALTGRGESTGGGLYNNYFYSSVGPAGTLMPTLELAAIPLPGALWLFAPALMGLMGLRRSTAASA